MSTVVQHRAEPSRRSVAASLSVAACVAGALALITISSPLLAVFASLVVLGLVASFLYPCCLAIVALPSALFAERYGPLTVTEVLLVLSLLSVFPYVPWQSRDLQKRLAVAAIAFGIYAATVVVHPSGQAIQELCRRTILVMGGLIIGASLAKYNRQRMAAWAALIVGSIFSIAAVTDAISSGFKPADPLGTSKNLAGGILTGMLLLTIATRGNTLGSKKTTSTVQVILLAGLLSTQSRGALVALLVGMAFLFLRGRIRVSGRTIAAFVALALVLGVAVVNLEQATRAPGAMRVSSISSRLEFQRFAYHYWTEDPVFGVGLRYYLNPSFDFPTPVTSDPGTAQANVHNIELEALSESGVIGLGALCVLVVGTVVVCRRDNNDWTVAGVAMIIAIVTQSQFDLYWQPGIQAMPWIIVGIGAFHVATSRQGGDTDQVPSARN